MELLTARVKLSFHFDLNFKVEHHMAHLVRTHMFVFELSHHVKFKCAVPPNHHSRGRDPLPLSCKDPSASGHRRHYKSARTVNSHHMNSVQTGFLINSMLREIRTFLSDYKLLF